MRVLSLNFASMIMRKILLAMFFVVCACSLHAQTIDALFECVPRSVLFMIEKTSRLDMLDLYNNGMVAKAENTLGGQSELLNKTECFMSIRTSDVGTWQMRLFTTEKDSMIVCVSSLCAKGVISNIHAYDMGWQPLKVEFPKPQFDSFLKKGCELNSLQGQYILSALREEPVSIALNDSTPTLTYRIDVSGMSCEDAKSAAELLVPVKYEWMHGRFVLKEQE